MRIPIIRPLLAAAVALTLVPAAAPSVAAPASADVPTVTYQDVLPHLERFQRIADDNGGNRAHGTTGFRQSMDYVRAELDAAGFRTRVETFRHDGRTGHNLIADWPGGDEGNVLLLGAHLDSVPEGPGMNDNASGAAALLTTALTVAEQDLRTGDHLRFAWWGAEELGLVGSRYHVAQRSEAELAAIDTYLNFDMTGTKDPSLYLLTDSGAEATDVFETYLNDHGTDTIRVDGGTSSDHASFAEQGIPVAGFTSGLGECYHQACDTLSNVDPATEALSTNALIDAVWELARTDDLSGIGDPYYPKDGNAGYDVGHYDVRLDYDPAVPDRLTGDTTVTATATQDLDRFHLDFEGYTIAGATVNGDPAEHRREGEHELVLTPSETIRSGKKFTVRVKYTGEPTGDAWHPIDGGGFAVYGGLNSATTWYPANDHPSDKATFSLTATVPDGWQVMGNGVPGRTTRADGRSTFRWHKDKPMATYLSTVAVDKFTVRRDTLDSGLPVIYAYGTGTTILPESEALLEPMIEHFSDLFGPYPFGNTGAIVVNARGGHPAFETQSRPTYSGGMVEPAMAHELSHMWFGNAVSISDWRNACIKECIAQYANQLWEEYKGADLDSGFYAHEIEANRDNPEFWDTRLYDPGKGKELDSALYSKGSLMIHALRKAMGDDSFFTLLKRWVRDHRHGNASWPEFERLAQDVSGKDLSAFFDAWAHSTTVPAEEYLFPAGR
ncbi:M28 family peptidase [Actinophytocola gossypii]|uniref:Aminopeptidase N n=1 Tax=Actinophytocola gossypii TaxID=2812003 RepID=A0ABT2JBL5_9PSEU|nr:M28 family peptidase [Actinophytocola gossypii]MCT2584959.1 M28 family peptidase [Actinophytocola gossypii]